MGRGEIIQRNDKKDNPDDPRKKKIAIDVVGITKLNASWPPLHLQSNQILVARIS